MKKQRQMKASRVQWWCAVGAGLFTVAAGASCSQKQRDFGTPTGAAGESFGGAGATPSTGGGAPNTSGGTGGQNEAGAGGNVCNSAACLGKCTPNQRDCVQNVPHVCSAAGEWKPEEACEFACTGKGVCSGVCVPTTKRCSGNSVETCTSEGEWGDGEPCDAQTPVCTGEGECGSPPSCMGLAGNCGPNSDKSCCSSIVVPGGSFNRGNNAAYPATLSTFRLDTYEVTVGRFRRFMNAYSQSMIPEGAGKHPRIPGDTGWQSDWNSKLPADQEDLESAIKCKTGYHTWSNNPGFNDTKPMACLSWWVANAFCIWDGGRLPTEAEWNYAAAGGDEQRDYPWGDEAPAADDKLAIYGCYHNADGTCTGYQNIGEVGLIEAGNGRWGHANLAGNLLEWTLDADPIPEEYAQPVCNDCANIAANGQRMVRGGSYIANESSLVTWRRYGVTPDLNIGSYTNGVRCARDE